MWNRIKWKIQSFMIGRNGVDDLSRVLIYTAIIMDVVALVLARWFTIPANILTWLSYGVCIYFLFRCFSRNISSRRKENEWFKSIVSLWRLRFTQHRQYIVFRCKGCGKVVRIPRHKGKIEVRCPSCGMRTIHNTGQKK